MNAKDTEKSIASYRHRMEMRKLVAVDAVRNGDWLVALGAINEAANYEAVMEELEFQIECMEVEAE